MYETVVREIRVLQNRFYFWIIVLISSILMLVIFMAIELDQRVNEDLFVLLLLIVLISFISGIIMSIITGVRASKAIKRIENESLLPVLLKQVDQNWDISKEQFEKKDVLNCLFIDQHGSFTTTEKITGSYSDVDYQLSFINNIIFAGSTVIPVFIGTYIEYRLNEMFTGRLHIRDVGNITNKKNLYEMIHHSELGKVRIYSSHEKHVELANVIYKYIYLNIKKQFKKGIFLSVYDDRLVLGINNSKNYFRFGLRRMSEKKLLFRLDEIKNIHNIIKDVCIFVYNLDY